MISGRLVVLAAVLQDSRQDPGCFQTEGELPEDLPTDLGRFRALFGLPIHVCQEDLKVWAVTVLRQRRSKFGDRLGEELAVCVHASKSAAREPDLVGLESLPLTDQALELLLNRRIGRVGLKCPFHMPDGGVEVALVFPHE